MHACSECGALVASPVTHAAWHESLNPSEEPNVGN